jgi:hypothetical protein
MIENTAGKILCGQGDIYSSNEGQVRVRASLLYYRYHHENAKMSCVAMLR